MAGQALRTDAAAGAVLCRKRCIRAWDSETEEPEVGLQEFRQIGTRKRPRVYECYWAYFAAEIHLSVLFEC